MQRRPMLIDGKSYFNAACVIKSDVRYLKAQDPGKTLNKSSRKVFESHLEITQLHEDIS